MFVAAKYEEIIIPHLSDFVHVASNVFTEQDLLNAEEKVILLINL